MRKLTLLITALFLSVGMAWAQPEVSDAPSGGKWSENTHWYQIKTGNGYYLRSDILQDDSKLALTNNTATIEDVALWCFVGNDNDGYTFYNKAKGPNAPLAMYGANANAYAVLAEDPAGADTRFDFTESKKTGDYWCLKEHGTDNNYWNRRSDRLAYWESSDAVNGWGNSGNGDDGSALLFTEVSIEELDCEFTDKLSGNVFTGTCEFRNNDISFPGCTLEDVFREGNKLTAFITFPFPVSKEGGVIGITTIASFYDSKKWHFVDNEVRVKSSGYDENSDGWLWNIYPKFSNGRLFYTIKSVGANKWLFANATDSELDTNDNNTGADNAVTLADEGTEFSIAFWGNNSNPCFQYRKENKLLYLSINSKDDTDVNLGVHTATHQGTECHFNLVRSIAPVAKIDEQVYYTFEAALAAAQAGDTITLVADVTCTEKPVFNNGGVVNVDINGHVLVSNEQGRIRNVASADGTVASNNIKFVSGFGWEVYSGNGVENANFRVFPTLGEAVAYIPASERVARIYLYENIKLESDVTLRKYSGGTSSTICVEPGYEITLDLNGCTVLQESPTGNPLEACIRGSLVLDDTSEAKAGKWIAGACGVTDTSNKDWYGGGGPAFYVLGDGELILKGGTVSIARNTSMNSNGEPVVNTGGLIRLDSGSLTVDGATLKCDDTCGVMAWGGKVVVNSGEFVMGEKGVYSVFASKYYADASVEVNTAIDGYLRISPPATATVNAAGVKYVADGTNTIAPAVGEGLIALDGQVYVPAVDVPENVVGNIVSNNSGNSNVTEDAVTAIVNNIYNNGAVIKYVPTNIPDGAKLVVELKNVIFESASTVPATVVYDVTPKKDGAKVEPENAITFRLPVPESWAGKYTKVYHAGTALEGMYPVQEGNYVEVASQDFSEFAVETVDYIVLPDDVNSSNYAAKFGDNTVTDGTNYYATLQAAVEAVAGQANAVLYCKPGADVGSLQHAPVTSTLTVYGNGADVTGGAERDFDLGNTDPSGGNDITADMTLTVKHLNGCGAWGAKATEHTVNLVFENCANMGKVFITGTTGTLNITMTDCAFEGVINEAVYSNADGAIILTNVAFSNLNKAVNLNHKAAGTQTVTINGCTFTNCGADVAADQIPVRVLSSVEGGKSVLTVTGSTFTGTPDGGADILLDYGVGLTTASVSGTAANVVVEKEHNVGTTTAVNAEETVEFTTALPVAQVGETKYMTLAEAVDAATEGATITMLSDVELTESLVIAAGKTITLNLNGKTVNVAWEDEEAGKHIYALTNNGTLTVTGNGTINTRGIYNYGAMTLTSGTINAIDGNGGYGVCNYDGATFIMNGGTIATTLEDDNKVDMGGYDATPVYVEEGATFTMNGGVINNICDFTVAINNYGTTIINDGKATTVHTTLANSGTMTINGGEFTCNGIEGITAHALWAAAGETTINGGTFNGKDNYNGFNVDAAEGAVVNITGGTFLPVHSGSLYGKGTITVSGGTFFDAVPADRCAEGYAALQNLDGKYVVGAKPTATIENLGSMLVKAGDYFVKNLQGSGDNSKDMPLQFVMKYTADQTAEDVTKSPYKDWYADFVLSFTGLKNGSFVADEDTYLAGFYGETEKWEGIWAKVGITGMEITEGTRYPVMMGVGMPQDYEYICAGVEEFLCAMNISSEILEANPDLKVTLELCVVDSSNDELALNALQTGGDKCNVAAVKNFVADDFEKVELPEVVITDIKGSLKDSDPDLTFALNFAIKDIENLTDEYLEKLMAQYGSWYTDYVLTISGLTDENVTFNANGGGDGYLAGQYDAWSENWVSVPFEDVTLANGASIYIMEYAAKLMNKQGLRFTLAEVAEIVQNFDCGVYFTPEFLAANPNMKVDLQLKVFTEDAEGNKVNNIDVATNNFDVEDYVAIVHAAGKQTKYCTTLADAVAAATDGATVTMLSNVELNEAVKVVGKAITLDLNGKTVSGTCNSSQGHLIYIENGAGLTVKDGAVDGGGKLTYAQGTSNVGWTVAVMGNLTLESGTIELTGSWDIGYAVDVRPNAWGVAYTAPSMFTMNGGNVVSSDGAVRVASSSSDQYANVSASFEMNGGKIDAAWDGVFIQQSNTAYDVLNFTINDGTIKGGLNPVRVYGPAPTSYVNGQECMSINFNGGTMTYTGTETREWVIDGVLRVGGGSSIETIVENGNITASEAFAQAQALPEGYIWEQDGETYKVVEAPKAPEVVDGKIEFVDGEFDMYTNDTDIEGVEITYKRTIDSDWNALYVPFAIPASELLADFDIAYINDVRETDADDDGELDGWQMELIKIKKETAVLRANHPYFVRSKSADYTENNLSLTLTTTLYKATVAEFECSSVYSTYTIKGLNELRASTEFGDADRVLGYDNGETTWGKMADGYSLKPFRFYLTITNHDGSPVVSSSAQMSIVVRDEDGTTGIDGIYGDENGETVIFDLYGRRVLEPEKGNIYIINGKKVLVQ